MANQIFGSWIFSQFDVFMPDIQSIRFFRLGVQSTRYIHAVNSVNQVFPCSIFSQSGFLMLRIELIRVFFMLWFVRVRCFWYPAVVQSGDFTIYLWYSQIRIDWMSNQSSEKSVLCNSPKVAFLLCLTEPIGAAGSTWWQWPHLKVLGWLATDSAYA